MSGSRWRNALPGLVWAALWLPANCAPAQEMTVYTTVSSVGTNEAKPRLIARSLTLFHAGKVYDYMEDVGEVVILEPAQTRFTILSAGDLATRVEFSELHQFLKVAQVESVRYLDELSRRPEREARPIAELLRFQLEPDFAESGDPAGSRLVLQGPVMRYEVQTAAPPGPQLAEAYLTYADWAARLNFVLHPRSSFPAPRLKLNAALRQRKTLPIVVLLETRSTQTVALRAEHKYQWELQAAEKAYLHKWERRLESGKLRWVGFHEYQHRLVADAEKRAK